MAAASLSSALNTVPFVSVDHMMKLVLRVGVERFLVELAARIEEDFARWEIFEKTARLASLCATGKSTRYVGTRPYLS